MRVERYKVRSYILWGIFSTSCSIENPQIYDNSVKFWNGFDLGNWNRFAFTLIIWMKKIFKGFFVPYFLLEIIKMK